MLGDYPVAALVPVTDLERAAAFYGGVLGLREVRATPDEGRTYECGAGTTLEVFRTRAGVAAGHTECGWVVDDVEAVVAQLREAGVVIEDVDLGEDLRSDDGIVTLPHERAAWFRDPDGNVLAVSQFLDR